MLNGSEEFGQKISRILQKFSVMMQALPQLGSIPVSDRLISQIKPGLADALGVKESERIIESFDRTTGTVMNVWNKITSLPHRVSTIDSLSKAVNAMEKKKKKERKKKQIEDIPAPELIFEKFKEAYEKDHNIIYQFFTPKKIEKLLGNM